MKRIFCKLTYKEVEMLVYQAADELGWNLIIEEKKPPYYELKVSADFLSFGNQVSINIANTSKRGKSITVTSTSTATLQVIDWGKNAKLEELLSSKIKELYETLRKK